MPTDKNKGKKKAVSVRELVDRYQENCERINAIAELCDTEQRERTEQENTEYSALVRENNVIQMKLQARSAEQLGGSAADVVDADAVLRERLLSTEAGQKVTVMLTREVNPQLTAALADTGIIPISEQEMLKPIRLGLIWDKVGINVRSGLVDTLRWPMHGKAYARFADEAERAVDSKIDYSALTMGGKRLVVAIPVTRETLEKSQGIVESIVKEEAPQSIIDQINDAMFCTTKTYKTYDAKTGTEGTAERKVYGPFCAIAAGEEGYTPKVSLNLADAKNSPRKQLLKIVANVAKKITLNHGCWVMTEGMKAELADIKVDAGSGRFLIDEQGYLLGKPIFITDAIGENFIGFGDWSYQAAGFFGQASFIVDPYTLARENSVDFVLNDHFGTATLRKDAFVLIEVTTGE